MEINPETGVEFRTFEDLEVYQVAREFRKSMYGITRRLPSFERFELSSQIRRTATSLTNNIAEGHGRYHFLDQLKFLLQARGSLEELIDDLNICSDESYLPGSEIGSHKRLGWRVHRIINGYGRYLRRRKATESSTLHETPIEYHINDESDKSDACDPFAELLL